MHEIQFCISFKQYLLIVYFWHRCRVRINIRDSGNTIHFSIFTMQIFPLSQKTTIPEYNAVSQSETEKFFFNDGKNNSSMSCVDKSRTCVCHVLKIVNSTNCCT